MGPAWLLRVRKWSGKKNCPQRQRMSLSQEKFIYLTKVRERWKLDLIWTLSSCLTLFMRKDSWFFVMLMLYSSMVPDLWSISLPLIMQSEAGLCHEVIHFSFWFRFFKTWNVLVGWELFNEFKGTPSVCFPRNSVLYPCYVKELSIQVVQYMTY